MDIFDIDSYLNRIGLVSRENVEKQLIDTCGNSYSLLHTISWNHAIHIPFENLATLYPEMRMFSSDSSLPDSIKVSLDPNDIFTKLVLKSRGGFCFEQNLLLARALREFGFSVTTVGVKLLNRFVAPELDSGLPLSCTTHMALLVDCQDGNRYLVDNGLGWGGQPRSPLLLSNGCEKSENTGEVFRLVLGKIFTSTKLNHDKWGCYRFKTGANINHQDVNEENGQLVQKKWFLQYKNKPESEWWDIMHFEEDNIMSLLDAELGAWYATTNPNHPILEKYFGIIRNL